MPLSPNNLSDNDRFHQFKSEYAQNALTRALKTDAITADDAKLIKSFVAERQITSSIQAKRILKWTSMLIQVRRFMGPFRENDIQDIYLGIHGINSGQSTKGKPYSTATRSDLIQTVKTFYCWLIDNKLVEIEEKKIKAIKRQAIKTTKTASDIISPEDIRKILDACFSIRERAALITMYEGGFRVGEIGILRWRDIKFDGTGVIVSIRFKTDIPRYVRLVLALEDLTKWKSEYPGEITDDKFVFLNEKQKPLAYRAVAKQLDRTAKRAGIEKRVTPHLFRHSRTTHLIQQGVSETVIKMILWGSVNSQMFAHYAHLSGSDIDREIFELYGIKPTVTQSCGDKLEPKICSNCHEINSPISQYCHICSHPLDAPTLKTADEFQKFILDNSDLFIEFLQERNANCDRSGLTAHL